MRTSQRQGTRFTSAVSKVFWFQPAWSVYEAIFASLNPAIASQMGMGIIFALGSVSLYFPVLTSSAHSLGGHIRWGF